MIEPGEIPRTAYLRASPDAFQQAISIGAVGTGMTASMKIGKNTYILYNKSGILDGQEGNRRVKGRILAGNLYIIGTTDDHQPRSLSGDELLKYTFAFARPEHFTEAELIDSHVDALMATL